MNLVNSLMTNLDELTGALAKYGHHFDGLFLGPKH